MCEVVEIRLSETGRENHRFYFISSLHIVTVLNRIFRFSYSMCIHTYFPACEVSGLVENSHRSSRSLLQTIANGTGDLIHDLILTPDLPSSVKPKLTFVSMCIDEQNCRES